jgi:hypothetical protein
MLPIQILLVLFFVLAIFKVIGRRNAGELSSRAMAAWVCFWIAAIYVVLQPNSTSSVAKLFGVGRGADVVVYLALAGLFFIVFRLMVKIEKLNREITSVVRDRSLNKK